MNKKNILKLMFAFLSFWLASSAMGQATATQYSKGFERFKVLVGKWEGTGVNPEGKSIALQVEYKLIAADSTIVEEWKQDGVPMITVFHDKAGRLGAVHYCALGNAPALKLGTIDDVSISLNFDEICGLDQKTEQFVTKQLYTFKSEKPTEFHNEYVVSGTGKYGNGVTKSKLKKVSDWSKKS
jgi:hypothetical protein